MTFNTASTRYYSTSLSEEPKNTGLWTLSRGEIVTLNNSNGNWHSSWTARIRPVARPREFREMESEMGLKSGVFLYEAFCEASQYFPINADIAHKHGTDGHHADVWVIEGQPMKAMDFASSQGIFK